MQDELEEYLVEYVSRREAGEDLSPEAFAAEHPDVEGPLREALERLESTEDLLRTPSDLPARIGPYQVVGTLGSGGMGRVLEVERHDRPGVRFALKLLHASAAMDARAVQRFQREVRLLSKLEHPGIVRIVDSGRAGAEPYLVMELHRGRSLAEVVAAARERPGERGESSADRLVLGEGTDGVRAAAGIVARLARAVESLHAAGVLHRDLKPSNVILEEGGMPILIDLGLAGMPDDSSLTRTGDLLGTPHYMAPEQARGEAVDARADVWALGAILYELLTLRPPHEGTETLAVLRLLRCRPVVPVRRLEPRVPRPLAGIVDRALAYRRAARYSSVTALARDLEAFLSGGDPRAGPTLGERVLEVWSLRRRELGLAAVATLALLAGWWMRSTGGERGEPLRRALDRAAMAWAVGDAAATERAARRALEMDPGNPKAEFLLSLARNSVLVDSPDAAIEELIRGLRAEADGLVDEARQHYRQASERDPASPLPLIFLGRIAEEEGELDERVDELRGALALQPRSAALARSLGATLFELRRYEEASLAFERAVSNDPEFPPAWLDWAKARFQTGGVEAGGDVVREAVAKLGDTAHSVRLGFADHLMLNGESTLARQELLELWGERPPDVDVACALARSWDFEERLVEAAEWYGRALDLDPEHFEALKGAFHLHAGANRDTCAACERAFREHPELYDPDRVAELGVRLLAGRGARNLGLGLWVAHTAHKVGRGAELRRAVEGLLGEARPEPEVEVLREVARRLEEP